jgi:hypothetical protein
MSIPAKQLSCRMEQKPIQETTLPTETSEARVPDEPEIVTTKEEADIRIRDLKEKVRME